MIQIDLMDIAKLRLCIGFLGESHQYAWWQSSFLSSNSSQFLAPVFEKTSFYSQYYGVKDAAAKVHDTHIGIGKGVFHLFRLPENVERELHEILGKKENVIVFQNFVQDKNQSEQFLKDYSKNNVPDAIGPVRLGDITDIDKKIVWQTVAHYYLNSFNQRAKVFPYFSGEK
jgi:hypothetical protein